MFATSKGSFARSALGARGVRGVLAALAVSALVLTSTSCGSRIDVRTIVAPDAGLAALHTFRILPAPARRDGRAASGSDDPMIGNSIANRALREQMIKSFESRGYVRDDVRPDFVVAFYATAREKLDVNTWDYGYPFYPGWQRYGPPQQQITQFTEGSVIVDVLRSGTRDLLWRGEGRAELSNDTMDDIKRLVRVVDAIVGKFPAATHPVVAERQ